LRSPIFRDLPKIGDQTVKRGQSVSDLACSGIHKA
jgi:hypothetical protein